MQCDAMRCDAMRRCTHTNLLAVYCMAFIVCEYVCSTSALLELYQWYQWYQWCHSHSGHGGCFVSLLHSQEFHLPFPLPVRRFPQIRDR